VRQVGDAGALRPGSRPTPPAVPYYSRGPRLRQATAAASEPGATGACFSTQLGRGPGLLGRSAIG
jgi:hypothetical protein